MNGTNKLPYITRKSRTLQILQSGEGINDACFNLATDLSIDACEALLFRLESAITSTQQFRKELEADADPGQVRD